MNPEEVMVGNYVYDTWDEKERQIGVFAYRYYFNNRNRQMKTIQTTVKDSTLSIMRIDDIYMLDICYGDFFAQDRVFLSFEELIAIHDLIEKMAVE